VSRRPIHHSSGRGARPVDVRDTRWNPAPGWGPPPRLCTDPDCDGVMRPQRFRIPPMRGRGPARRYIPSNARTVTVWTCLVCGRHSN
jgi:hypothetical protein